MYRSGTPYRCFFKTDYYCGLKFGENQANGHVSGLHYTWLVPRTWASSDDVDGFLTLRVDPLEEGCSTLRAWPNRYLRGYRIMLYGGTVAYWRVRRGSKLRLAPRLTQDGQRYHKPLNLVPRGTQIPYSAAVDLVAGLGVSQVVSELYVRFVDI
ncbi:hypothetical protein M9H77_06528 [Catharanthus roseus]|uniref:Uncharacterized protein n=1 Tax=Catharanthus roseus TaxID=4058 RepID=A0ACC0BSD0_CATRO|nr:hypothetical protein M9H77_06528 [Catharanthus roseus]